MSRLPINKTYKLYIGGKFPRTESGRYYKVTSQKLGFTANVCSASRKDFREAVVTARAAFPGWSGKSAYNRGQILYRMGEMLEGRRAQFVQELEVQGSTKKQAESEVDASIDRLIHYAGWSDKYSQIFSSVNPVASSHFNFSIPIPTGVVALIADDTTSLLGLVSLIAPAIVGGNTVVAVASTSLPLCGATFGEILSTSDVPGGVVNILTGDAQELLPHMASHMDVNAVFYARSDEEDKKRLQIEGAENMKRVKTYDLDFTDEEEGQSPYLIMDAQEIQTTWHPIGI